MCKNKQAGKLLLLSVLSEAVVLTDSLAIFISKAITKNIIIRYGLFFLLTYIFWITGIICIRRLYKKQYDIQVEYCQRPDRIQVLTGLLLLIVITIIDCINWHGFKVAIELMHGIKNGGTFFGIAYFVVQYFYYFLETIFIVMIISFSQEAGTMLFKKKNIPYGGIVLAVIWGLDHIIFHGVVDGLTTTATAVLYGFAFLAMNKNKKYAIPLIFLMFIV